MLVFYEENNKEHLALYLGLGLHTIYYWNRDKPRQFDISMRGWNELCKEKDKAEVPEGVEIQFIKKKDKYVRKN